MTVKITPLEAAEAVGLDPFAMANYLRDEAATKFDALSTAIRHGNESNQGDVDYGDITEAVDAAWKLLASAKVCDAHWQAEIQALGDDD